MNSTEGLAWKVRPKGLAFLLFRPLIALVALFVLAGCGANPFESGSSRAARIAVGLTKTAFQTRNFDLIGYYRLDAPADGRFAVYIEGDGVAYVTRFERAIDPTPERPIALELAARHPGPNVLYLARPCQFTGGNKARNCDSRYWTSHRYAPEAVEALEQAIRDFAAVKNLMPTAFYGYSGGAAMAMLVAARRPEAESLVTVAGVLDHEAWTRHFGDAPLHGSLNPADQASRLRHLAQRHFIGGKDDQVPPGVAAAYLGRLGPGAMAMLTEIRTYGHECCWADGWPELATRPLVRLPAP